MIQSRPVAEGLGAPEEAEAEARAEGGSGDRREAQELKSNENNWSQDRATKKSSYKERRVDAKAPYADEGRGKLRKASGSCKQALIRRYPNGGTRPG